MRFTPSTLMLIIPLTLTIVFSNPTGRLAAFRNYGVMIPPNVISSRSERYDREPSLGLSSQRAILGPRWNLPSQVTHGLYKVIRYPKDEGKTGGGQEEEEKLTAGELLKMLKPLKSEESSSRELKWGFW